jgi:hypothetical protein
VQWIERRKKRKAAGRESDLFQSMLMRLFILKQENELLYETKGKIFLAACSNNVDYTLDAG